MLATASWLVSGGSVVSQWITGVSVVAIRVSVVVICDSVVVIVVVS